MCPAPCLQTRAPGSELLVWDVLLMGTYMIQPAMTVVNGDRWALAEHAWQSTH